jgi:hypothetical protein
MSTCTFLGYTVSIDDTHLSQLRELGLGLEGLDDLRGCELYGVLEESGWTIYARSMWSAQLDSEVVKVLVEYDPKHVYSTCSVPVRFV